MATPEDTNDPLDDDWTPYALIAYLKLSDDEWGDPDDHDAFWELENALTEAINNAGVGVFDGMAEGMGFYDLYMHGPDADKLLAIVEPILRAFPARPGSYLEKRDDANHEHTIRIDL